MNNDLTFDPDIPRRGGDGRHGIYMGGAPLNRRYMSTGARPYRGTSQLRTIKASTLNEATLNKALRDTKHLKFEGKLEIENAAESIKELDKEEFLAAVKKTITQYGLESFFYMPNSHDEMTYIVDEPHAFDVDTVLNEYRTRLDEPAPVTAVNGGGFDIETEASKLARFRCYDSFEAFDIYLSRLAIESLISTSVRTSVGVRFNHLADFDDFPGQVYLMMILEVCNASAAADISGASELLLNMKLSQYPGENMEAFSSDALRYIKIMQTAYALPYNTGQKILLKVVASESALFNCKIYARHDDVQAMEDKYELKDPKLITTDPEYPTIGPIPTCAFVQKEYSDLIKKKNWPAKSVVRPEGNNAPANGGGIIPNRPPAPTPSSDITIPLPTGADIGRHPNHGNRQCHKCNSFYHMANWSNCPKKADRSGGGGGRGGFVAGRGAGRGNGPAGGLRSPNANEEWKYAHPPDTVNGQMTLNGNTWFFCLKCTCKYTGKVGFFNKTHNTPDHTDPNPSASDAAPGSAPAASRTFC